MNGEFRTVEIEQVVDSRTNPRRHFSEHGMEELQQSIRDQGMLVPLLVRPVVRRGKPPRTSVAAAEDGKHDLLEVVAGSRRLRAARAAGLKELPVRVVELSDGQAMELGTIDNLQREDVHPLDEAQGYRALMATGKYDASALALKLGKSESYVYQRLKLNDLIKPAETAFWEEKIGLGHALLLARLQPNDQARVLKEAYGLRRGTMTPADLAGWIDRILLLRLKDAPFRPGDTELVPAAGSCEACPKRTGSLPQLFPDIKAKDTCTDSSCYDRKVAAHIAQRTEEYSKRGETLAQIKLAGYVRDWKFRKGVLEEHSHFKVVDGKPCEHAKPGIVVVGDDLGKVVQICTDSKCKAHGGAGRSAYRRSPRELEEEKRRRERERQQAETYRLARHRVVDTVTRDPLCEADDLRFFAKAMVRQAQSEHAKLLCHELVIEVPKDEHRQRDFRKTLVKELDGMDAHALLAVMGHLAMLAFYGWGMNMQEFDEVAAERGVDVKRIAKQVAAEAATAEKAKAAKSKGKKGKPKAAAKPPTKARKKGKRA